mgnify:CR=1 FL=1
MINNILNNGYIVSLISEKTYKNLLDKQIKGHSKYDNYSIIEYLPKNKEFYVIDDNETSYEDGYCEYDFSIATTYKGMYFIITDSGSN